MSFQESLVVLGVVATVFAAFAAGAKEGSQLRRLSFLVLSCVLVTAGVLVWNNYLTTKVSVETFSSPAPDRVANELPLSARPPTLARTPAPEPVSQLDPRLDAAIERAFKTPAPKPAGQLDPLGAAIDRAFKTPAPEPAGQVDPRK
jgi:hypothetical protein